MKTILRVFPVFTSVKGLEGKLIRYIRRYKKQRDADPLDTSTSDELSGEA